MLKTTKLIFILLSVCAGMQAAVAEPTYDEILDSIVDPVPEKITDGKIEALDLTARTGTIGGYRYHFGPSTISQPLEVKLIGRNFGSLELLSVGMDVRVYYFEAPSEHRVALELIQIAESEVH